MYTYEYPRPALTADIVLFDNTKSQVLLIKRGHEPFKDHWAFPGGFFDMSDTDIEHTAHRELEEETGLRDVKLSLIHVASKEGRDPRGRTVTVIFTGQVDADKVVPRGGDDAKEAQWFRLDSLPPLAFDHDEILSLILNNTAN